MNTYTVHESDLGFTGGRYKSKTPSGAAKKAATRMFRTTNKKSVVFTIRQTTQGTDKKLYKYRANQVKLDKPFILTIKGVQIEYKYKVDITPLDITTATNKSTMKGGGTCNENFCSI